MTLEQMIILFEQFGDDVASYVEPEDRELHPKEDLNAFLLLAKLVPDDNNLIVAAEHDVIHFTTDVEDLARVATEEDIKNLVRDGVFYDTDTDSLSMFV